MGIYDDILLGHLQPTEENFKQMIEELFNYDEQYDIYIDFKKAPMFYQRFIGKNCKMFFNTLTKILQVIEDKNMTVYKDANIVTLMAAATFHMNKLYCSNTKYTDFRRQRVYISEPFADWLSDIHKQGLLDTIDMHQQSNHFAKPITYIILNSYVSFDYNLLKNTIRPLHESQNSIIDSVSDIIIPIVDDTYTDLYGFGLNLFKKLDPVTSQYATVNDFICDKTHFFIYKSLSSDNNTLVLVETIFELVWYPSTYSDEDFDYFNYEYFDYDFIQKLSSSQYEICLMIFKSDDIPLFDYNEKAEVLYNEKFKLYVKNVFNMIDSSDDLIRDTLRILSYFDPKIFSNIHFTNETILHPLIRNIMRNPISKNISFVQSLMMQLFYNNIDSKYIKYSFDYPYNGANYLYKFALFFDIEYYQDLLFEILDSYFIKEEILPSNNESPTFGFLSQSSFINKYSLKLSPNSPNSPPATDAKKLKEIIKIFIKIFYERKYSVKSKQNFIQKIKSYKSSLLTLGIDVTKYGSDFENLKFSPALKLQSAKRSIDKELFKSPAKMNSQKKKDNIFYKKSNDAQVTEFKNIKFADENLLHKLQKYYIRTVAGMTSGEYDKPDRIMKIRKYLQNRYPLKIVKVPPRLEVPKGKDLQTLYDHWKDGKPLNTNYFIIFLDENGEKEDGIDAGGLTKSFFTNIIKQMKEKYFKPTFEKSDKYILNTTDPLIAKFIGELLCVLICREIYLNFNISTVYLGHLLYDNLKYEELFLYYLLDIKSDIVYQNYLQYCENSYKNDNEYDENYYYAMACNPEYIVKEIMTDFYQPDGEVFKAFCSGFFIEKKIFYNKFFNIGKSKIRIYDIDKLLTMTKLSKKALKKDIFDKVELNVNKSDKVYKYFEEIMISDTKLVYAEMYNMYDASYIKNDKIKKQVHNELASQQVFKEKVLLFWTGCRGTSNIPYVIYILNNIGPSIKSHTCTNMLELPSSNYISSKKMLFDKFMEMFITGQDSGYSDR